MIHQYKLNGYNIVLDICSGGVHVVDDVAYYIISVFEENDKETDDDARRNNGGDGRVGYGRKICGDGRLV